MELTIINAFLVVCAWELGKHAFTKKYKILNDKYYVKKYLRLFYKEVSQGEFIEEFNK